MRNYMGCILSALILLTVSACGSGKQADTPEKDIAVSSLQEQMLAADTTLPEMETVSSGGGQDALNFSYLSDLSYDLVESYFYAYAKDGTAEEIAVVKLRDKGDAAEMMDSLHGHVAQRKGMFQEYAPEQVELAEHAVVAREGRYIALIICEKNGMVQKAFQACFE